MLLSSCHAVRALLTYRILFAHVVLNAGAMVLNVEAASRWSIADATLPSARVV